MEGLGMKKSNAGFTLIELMIVVAIIAIIAAIAIPNLLRSRMSANEAGAAGAMRTISTAEVSYQAAGISLDATGVGLYGTLAELAAPAQGQPFIDTVLGAGQKHGYAFAAIAVDSTNYTCNADPLDPGRSGVKAYFVDASGVIRFTTDGTVASVASPPMT
jgi:prepilin-type N-terminal cleavage/methylation domain-containing protein